MHPSSPYSTVLSSPLGMIGLTINETHLTVLTLLPPSAKEILPQDKLSKLARKELQAYFDNPHYVFTSLLQPAGTAFQQKVWRALQTIPSGDAWTYGELAKKLKTSPRAIGQACRTNPLPIIIPCHRIIAANHLGGYAGKTTGKLMDVKKWLLKHEGVIA